MNRNWFRIVILGGFVLLLAACGQAGAPDIPDELLSPPAAPLPVNDAQPESEKEDTQMTQPAQPPPSPGMEFLIGKAKENLSKRLSIEITQISLVEAKEVVWPDSSLGCPQPGMKYKQVPEDGALIILEAQGTTYEYHNGGGRGLFLCEKVISNLEKPPQIDITDLTPRSQDNNDPPPSTPDQGIPPGENQ